MRKRLLTIICLAVLPLCLLQAKDDDGGSGGKVFTGISGGVSVHGGYLFAMSPDQLFSNTGLGNLVKEENLKKSGFCYGFGAQLRVHLIDHIHLGAEVNQSNMPLMGTGSNVTSAWGGAFADLYGGFGKTKLLVGLGIGGGQTKRLFVPTDGDVVDPTTETTYNSSYTKTPFFYLDPYVGLETDFGLLGFQIKIDYLLPFGNPGSNLAKNVTWSNFLAPSGPRVHLALLFGKL
jgi:hypothetical protein